MKTEQTLSPAAARPTRRIAGTRAPVPPAAPAKQQAFIKLAQTKIVTPRGPATDARTIERERLVASLLAAQGRPGVTQATEQLLGAGHALPDSQEVHLQVLEHADESRVRSSIAALDALLAVEPPKRRPVLEQRLKRIEESADDVATRDAATALRRKL